MPYSNEYTNMILDWSMGKRESLPKQNKVYVGFCRNDPEAEDTYGVFTELSGDTYGRILVSQLGETYPAIIGSATDRVISNIGQIANNKATADWETANGIGFFTTETGGSPFWFGKLSAAVTTVAGAVMLIDPGALRIGLKKQDEEIAATASA